MLRPMQFILLVPGTVNVDTGAVRVAALLGQGNVGAAQEFHREPDHRGQVLLGGRPGSTARPG